jgi:hypothetical protein
MAPTGSAMIRADVDAARCDAQPAVAVPDEGRLGLTRARNRATDQQPTALGDRAEGVVIPLARS